VPHGGNFDGVVGVVAALELLRAAPENLKVAVPLELVIWAEEEGTTFGLGMLGSRAFVGELGADRLAQLKGRDGKSYVESGAPHGVDASQIGKDVLNRGAVLGLIEVHVEQGPGLWKDQSPAGIVTAIAGRRQYQAELCGVANHAGSTQMSDRADALAGAAEIVLAVERLGRELGHRSVATVGRIECRPNAVNVIADQVDFTIDLRSPAMESLHKGDKSIRQLVESIAAHRHLTVALDVAETQSPVEMDPRLCAKLRRAASARSGDEIPDTTSGALHDAAVLAPKVPTAMLFVASRDGISHNPEEFSRIEDIALAAGILMDTVRDRRLE
ncbi:MAG: Zn-dependent hydrolase, partial [Tepidisphaeraceae bacterium]